MGMPIRDYNSIPPKGTPPGFKELIRIIWSFIRLNRVLNLGGVGYLWRGREGGGGTKTIVIPYTSRLFEVEGLRTSLTVFITRPSLVMRSFSLINLLLSSLSI